MCLQLRRALYKAMAIAVACLAFSAFAADPKPPAKMDEPMAGKMRKPGMKQSDVKKEAQKKSRAMKPKIEKEEKEMPHAPK
ncbi:MAG TPA: hypothetical protein VFJ70_00370 [Burkholderiales bacterium]|nr:hypothetical protein [Burkholderiales bacterium]